MNYKRIIERSFSALTPPTANEEIIRNVTERAEKKSMKKKFKLRKPIIAVCAAIAALMLGTVTVGAATDWDYFGVFSSIFGEKAENLKGYVVPEATQICDDIDHLDFEIAAAAADRQSVILIIDIFPQNATREELPEDILKDLHFGMYYDTGIMAASSQRVIEETDEKIRVAVRGALTDRIDGQRAVVYAHGRANLMISGEDKNSVYYTGNSEYWKAEFTADFTENEITYDTDVILERGEDTFHVDEIVVTPLNVYAYGERNGKFYAVKLNDRKYYAIINNGENTDEDEISEEDKIIFRGVTTHYLPEDKNGEDIMVMNFTEPINPEDITAVSIGEEIIELK